jgi:hypothetical protein
MNNQKTGHEPLVHQHNSIIERLMPGAGVNIYRHTDNSDRRKRPNHQLYRVLSCMSAAMRSRAEAHNRSTERVEIPNASEVSAVVKPAK